MSEPDLSEFEKLSKPRRPDCPLKAAADSLEGEEAEQLQAALDASTGTITAQAISLWLGQRDIQITWQRITSHRNGQCTCGR